MSVFKEPQCLIYKDSSSKKLCLDGQVVDQLTKVSKHLHVIAIAGLYRTGKSYLLTRIARRYTGFPLGSAIESKTKGIWAWCIDHPVHQDQALLLLDTEGLGDVEKDDRNDDNMILTLATLLSSTLIIYNTFGAFDDIALNNLNFITEMEKRIKTTEDSQSVSGDTDFDVYFPEFILALRDFPVNLAQRKENISPDEYLEHCLEDKEGASEDVKRYNEPRMCIRKYFKKRKCFVFAIPATSTEERSALDELKDTELNENYVENTDEFLGYIHNKTAPMALTSGRPATGSMFCTIVMSYINAIREGDVPCIQSTLRAMAFIENEIAVNEAMRMYRHEMNTRVKLPTQTEQELRDVHLSSKGVAFNHFLKRRVLDEDNMYELTLDTFIHKVYEDLKMRREDALKSSHATNSSNIDASVDAVPGGYELYRKDRGELIPMHFKTEGFGVQQSRVNVEYGEHKQKESEAVLKSIEKYTETEKAVHQESENRKRAEEREEAIKKHWEETKKEMADLRSQHAKEIEKVRTENKQHLAEERVRYNNLLEERLDNLKQVQEEKVRKIENEYVHQIESLQRLNQWEDDLTRSLKMIEAEMKKVNENNQKAKWWELFQLILVLIDTGLFIVDFCIRMATH